MSNGGKPRRARKPYAEMTTEELAEATKEFDEPFVMSRSKPLDARDRELHRQAKKLGRPKKGEGREVVSLSIERGLLKRADAMAKRRKIGRSQFVSEAIEDALSRAKAG